MIIQLGIMTCAQRIYINNDDVHSHSPLQNQRGVTYVGCMCGNDFLDLATLLKGRMCAGICVCVVFKVLLSKRLPFLFTGFGPINAFSSTIK